MPRSPDRALGGVPASVLTEGQREIAALIADGSTNRAIAERLGVELGTVDACVARLFWELDLTSRTQVSVWAARQGLYPRQG